MMSPAAKPPIPPSITFHGRRRRWLTTTAWVLGICALVVCRRTVQTPITGDDYSRYDDRSFKVARVVDGDTFDIHAPDANKPTTRIRLWGVDTPETGKGNRPAGHFGEAATQFAQNILEGNTIHVALSPKRTRGKYGRLLAYVYLERGGKMFNEMLLEGGYAYADRRFGHLYKKQFEAIEKRARRDEVGLWKDVTLEGMPEWYQRFETRRAESGGE